MYSFFISVIVTFITILLLVLTFFKQRYQYWKKLGLPSPTPSIPFGNIESPYKRKDNFGVLVSKYYTSYKKKGEKHVGIFLLSSPNYIPINLTYVKNILTKDFQHFIDRGIYVNEKDDPLGANLFAIAGLKWRNLRTKLTPTFTTGKMKNMFQTLTDCGLVLEKYLKEKIKDSEPFDIKEILACFTTDIIGNCAFGLECNTFKDPNSPFRVYGKKIFAASKFDVLLRIFAFTFPNVARKLGIRLLPKDSTAFFYNIVENTVKYRQENNITRKDFLQLLIDMKEYDNNALTMNELAAQSLVFFIAGFETSSTAMTFALYELASNPEIQNKAREEVFNILNNHDGKITYDAINDMKYLQQVVDESLRKYPPLPVLSRVCVEDYKIPDDNIILTKGTKIIIPVYGIHYDEEFYPNPNKFDPERFSEEMKRKRNPYTYLPFGEGPRNCIGMRFGLMQSKVGLAYLLKNFLFTLNEKTEIPLKMSVTSFILMTDSGIWLNATKI